MHFQDNVIAYVGPACAFALEPVARLAAYWNTPIITGMGDQVHRLTFYYFYLKVRLTLLLLDPTMHAAVE